MAHLLARELAAIDGNTVFFAAHRGDVPVPADLAEPYERMPIRATNWFERKLGVPLLIPHPTDVLALQRAAREADILIVHDSVYLANLAAIAAAPETTRTIVVKHTGEVRFSSLMGRAAFSLFTHRLAPLVLRKTDALAFVTQTKLDNSRPIEGPRSLVIPNGIDTSVFAPDGSPRDDRLLFVGRFVAKKGIGIVREMARLMPERRFVVAGYGSDDPRQWGLSNVECHWQPSPTDIAKLLSRCHAAILPGETEGTPLVALEALACEARVVIGEMGKAPDGALDRQMARLPVDVEDPKGTAQIWAARLDETITLSSPDRGVIEREYSASRMARDYADLIAELG